MASPEPTQKPNLIAKLSKYNKFYIAVGGFAANGILAAMDTSSVYYPIVSAIAAALVVAIPNKKASA